MFIRSMLQDLLKLEKLIYNTEEGRELQLDDKESTKLNEKKHVMLTASNKIILY